MAAIDRQGTILYRARRETPLGECVNEIVRAIVESANECRKNCDGFQVKAISTAVPGTVNVSDGIIITAPNLTVLNDFRMVAALENKLGIKAVLENDANVAAVGENWLGVSKGCKNSIDIIGNKIFLQSSLNQLFEVAGGRLLANCVTHTRFPSPHLKSSLWLISMAL